MIKLITKVRIRRSLLERLVHFDVQCSFQIYLVDPFLRAHIFQIVLTDEFPLGKSIRFKIIESIQCEKHVGRGAFYLCFTFFRMPVIAGMLKLKQNCFCKHVPHDNGFTYFTKNLDPRIRREMLWNNGLRSCSSVL